MSKITVYTCITGAKDKLRDDQVKGKAEFIAFTDIKYPSKTWKQLPAYDRFKDPRRNSRIQKILSHQYIDTEYSIYVDGNISLLVSPEELIKKHLENHDIAVFKHPNRNCLYEEALVCANKGLDDTDVLIGQMRAYEKNGYARHKGLAECGIIMRRHTSKLEEFENAWWAEFCRHSRRDQVSCMYAMDKVGIRVNLITDYFLLKGHDTAIKQSNEFHIQPHEHMI